MKKAKSAAITTIAFLVLLMATFYPVSGRMLVNVFPLSGFKGYQRQITINLNDMVDIYAQVSYVNSGRMPPSNFTWYINGVPVKDDVIGSSTLTFAASALGVYNITVTVNGETNSEFVTVIVIDEPPIYSNPENNVSPISPTITPTTIQSLPSTDRNAPHLEPIEYLLPISIIVAIVIAVSVLLLEGFKKPLA